MSAPICIFQVDVIAHPFHIPNTKPHIVPSVDHPTSGGKDTPKMSNQRTKYASGDFSHFSANGPTQMNILPVRSMKAMPIAIVTSAAQTAPTLFQKLIRFHVSDTRRPVPSAQLMSLSRKVTASWRDAAIEFRLSPSGRLHGGRTAPIVDDVDSAGERGSDRARAVD